MTVRVATESDVPALGALAEAAELFPAELLPQMIEPALTGADDTWLVAAPQETVLGFAFARPEEMTDRVWNILALGVAAEARKGGLATALLVEMEKRLDARMIIIETTQLPEQAAARAFYENRGYDKEGQVRDFYAKGEDKIIYRKVLA